MKKFLLVLGMATCLFGMTACGSDETAVESGVSQEELEATYQNLGIDEFIASLDEVVTNNMQEQVAGNAVYEMGIASWEGAKEDLGAFVGVTGHTVTGDEETITATVSVDGELHDANVVLVIETETYMPTSITVNVIKSFGELMTNAALNTLLGMGTVFIVLIFIAWLISCFKYINVIQDKLTKKNTASAPAQAPAAVAAPVVEEAAEEDDLELVAVIAAAIAASEGAASTDGFVVRSIKRRSNKWQKA